MDGDLGTFGEFVFSLSDEDRGKPFSISTEPGGFGYINTTDILNFEQVENYTLTVTVEDLAENEMDKMYVLACDNFNMHAHVVCAGLIL